MAIGEKKAILRGMYENNAVPAGDAPDNPAAQAPATMLAKSAENKSIDRFFSRLAHAAIYFLILVGWLAIGWTFHTHYAAGYAWNPWPAPDVYVRDVLRLAAMAVLLILLGVGILILFRETLPRGWKWMAFGLLVMLLPSAFISGFLFPLAYSSGRNAAYADLDFSQIQLDADALLSLYPDGLPHMINLGDPDFAKVPPYTRGKLKAVVINIDPAGVTIINDKTPGGSVREEDQSGLYVPASNLSSADAGTFARNHNMTILGGKRPVMRFENLSATGP